MSKILTKYFTFALATILLSVSFAAAQEIRVKAALERDSIWLGDQIKLLVVAELSKGDKLTLPHLPDTIQKIEILKRSKIDTSILDGTRIQIKQTYLITCFDSGAHQIPSYYFKVVNGAHTDSLKSGELTLNVKFPPIDLKKGPADIKKPFAAPITFKEIAPWILGIILLAAIVFLVIYYISRRNKNRPLFERPAKPKIPAHILAIQELDKLKSEQLWQQEKVKEYYTRLTDIVREYIEERFTMAAMEQTTPEILQGFKNLQTKVEHKSILELKQILELADLVKFAKLNPLPDENFNMLNNAYLFVKETKIESASEKIDPAQPEIKADQATELTGHKEEV
jgi:hypothetical protein